MKPTKTFQSFADLAKHFPKKPETDFQLTFRISSTWKHFSDSNFHLILLGANFKYYKNTRGLCLSFHIIGININLSLHTKRNAK